MKITVRKLAIIIPTVLLAVAAVLLRSIACLSELNYATGHFADSTLARVSGWIAVVVVALLLLLLPLRIEVTERRASFRGPLTYLPSGVLAATLLFSSADLFGYVAEMLGGIFTRKLLTSWDCISALIVALLAIFAVGYCIASALIPTVRSSLRANLGMLTALCFAFYTVHLFFRVGSPLNNPAKVADQMAFLSASLFMLAETRLSLGRAKWKNYFVFGAISSILCAFSSIPALITYAASGEIISESIQQSLLLFALLIFSACRLVKATMLDKNRPSSFVTAIDSDTLSHQMQTAASEAEEYSEPPQLSIDDIEETERQNGE